MTEKEIWILWIRCISEDKEMGLDRLLRHIQLHVGSHMPNSDAPGARWVRWIAGTYNLLGILCCMTESEPNFGVGIARLFRHWQTAPFDHTPPPKGLLDITHTISEEMK